MDAPVIRERKLRRRRRPKTDGEIGFFKFKEQTWNRTWSGAVKNQKIMKRSSDKMRSKDRKRRKSERRLSNRRSKNLKPEWEAVFNTNL
jgi:hypothetical protein